MKDLLMLLLGLLFLAAAIAMFCFTHVSPI